MSPHIIVLTAADLYYSACLSVSRPNKASYCARHGYRFVCKQERAPGHDGRPVQWDKVRWVQRYLAECDWLFWTDADSVVMTPHTTLESFLVEAGDAANFVVRSVVNPDSDSPKVFPSGQTPPPGVQTLAIGEFLIRNCPWSERLLQATWEQEDFADRPWWEMGALNTVWREQPWAQAGVYHRSTPGWLMGMVNLGEWHPGDFIAHFPGMGPPGQRSRTMRDFLNAHGGW